jgi:hypothetical protein
MPTRRRLLAALAAVEAAGDRWNGRVDEDRNVALPLAVDADGVRIDAWPDAGADLRFRNEGGPRIAGVVLRKTANARPPGRRTSRPGRRRR